MVIWRSEDHFWELVFYSHIGSRNLVGLSGWCFYLLIHLTSSGKFNAIARPLKQKQHLFNYCEDLTGYNIYKTCLVQYLVSLWTLSPWITRTTSFCVDMSSGLFSPGLVLLNFLTFVLGESITYWLWCARWWRTQWLVGTWYVRHCAGRWRRVTEPCPSRKGFSVVGIL